MIQIRKITMIGDHPTYAIHRGSNTDPFGYIVLVGPLWRVHEQGKYLSDHPAFRTLHEAKAYAKLVFS